MGRQWPLVGRFEEIQVIARATRTARDRAQGIVLSGVAGVGKTRLAREAIAGCGPHNARRRWIAATASARSVPLGAFADIATSFGPDPLRRVREVIDALLGDSKLPVILGVDDTHHLDELSAFTVHQLVTRRLATVILTMRAGEHPPDAITSIWKDRHLERLELQPLSLAETTSLVEEVLEGPVHSLSAQRLWQYTQGNVLYLHHLLDSELSAGRITQQAGVWLWDGQPALSPTLAELIEARIADAPKPVRGVLDALAVSEPLETAILATVTDPDALDQAESHGLVRVDTRKRPASARLAHPLFGEVCRTSSLRQRHLRGRIATELAQMPTTDPRNLVRRAALTLESDLTPDVSLLLEAAAAAMQLLDAKLAEVLAERAVAAGGGPEAKIAYAAALTWQERGTETETVLAELADQTSGPLQRQVAVLRTFNLAVILGQAANAERELDAALPDDDTGDAVASALRAWIDAARGHAVAGVNRTEKVLANSHANDFAILLSTWVLVTGLGDLGRIDAIETAVKSRYSLFERSADASHLRFPLAAVHAHAYLFAGALTMLDRTIARIRRDTLDAPFAHSWHTFLAGMAAMSRGALAEAQRSLHETLASLGAGDRGRVVKGFARSWSATVTGMAGKAAEARREFAAIRWWADDPDVCQWDSERSMAEAWVCAAEGATPQAISVIRAAAELERQLDRPAREVLLLQMATQFGDPTTADRLAELAGVVQGPRAPAAAAHAAALAAANGDALLEASTRYEDFGDRLAAADAAAHAVVAYQDAGRRGSALTASATAQRLAAECQGAETPALRAAAMPLPITARQREIIALAAQGLSNKEIAERLTMSVRSVQGHLFRASQRVGVNSRDKLIALLRGT